MNLDAGYGTALKRSEEIGTVSCHLKAGRGVAGGPPVNSLVNQTIFPDLLTGLHIR